ncbi:alpha/beta hydrolase [Desulfobacterales bacterium HSG17]|nr:alpha/beta hydrolase [Desulfobacterales bacterium HSG17]
MPVLITQDLNIYYEITGKGSPLLLIHGLGSSTRDWESQVKFLSKHFKVIAFDVRGHGKTGKPPGSYSVSMFAKDTANLIRALDISPVHAAGISMGGMIAFQLGIDAPELVKSLSIINSGPELILRTPAERALFFQRKLIVRIMGMKFMGKILAHRLLPEPGQKLLHSVFIKRWSENDKKTYMASLNAIIGWSISDKIASIKCPVHIIASDMDYTPVSYKKSYMEKLQNAEITIIKNSRHLSPGDQPAQVNYALIKCMNLKLSKT